MMYASFVLSHEGSIKRCRASATKKLLRSRSVKFLPSLWCKAFAYSVVRRVCVCGGKVKLCTVAANTKVCSSCAKVPELKVVKADNNNNTTTLRPMEPVYIPYSNSST